MRVSITVNVDITLCDDDLSDPAPGDPLEYRMRTSALEAIRNAVNAAEMDGFRHDLEDLTSIEVASITTKIPSSV